MQTRRVLWEKLQTLQCHFTWNIELNNKADVEHLLQCLTFQVEHNVFHNHGTYRTMKAFLYHLQKRYCDALKSLEEAERYLTDNIETNITCQVLLIYGNYAWIYYYLSNYSMTHFYLHRIYVLCRSVSSPEPYSLKSSEILAQKGWSLLMATKQNGMKAKECFDMALSMNVFSAQFWAGLAVSLYSIWEERPTQEYWVKAKELLEVIVRLQPQYYEMKVYLAILLSYTDEQQVNCLLKEVVENSHNPEDLRKVARVSMLKPEGLLQAICVLKKAISLAPNYDILYYELGGCYKHQMETGSPESKAEISALAMESFHRAAEINCLFIDPMLEVAKIYGIESPQYEEEIYVNLGEKASDLSKRCQQLLYLQWGDFLLQKKKLKLQASKKYMAGLQVAPEHSKENSLLVRRLINLIISFQEASEANRAEAICVFLRTWVHQNIAARGQYLLWFPFENMS